MDMNERCTFKESVELKNSGFPQKGDLYFKADLPVSHENYHRAVFTYESLLRAYGTDGFMNSKQWIRCPLKSEI